MGRYLQNHCVGRGRKVCLHFDSVAQAGKAANNTQLNALSNKSKGFQINETLTATIYDPAGTRTLDLLIKSQEIILSFYFPSLHMFS